MRIAGVLLAFLPGIAGPDYAKLLEKAKLTLSESIDKAAKELPGGTDVSAYMERNAIPEHPLKAKRYLSIGCWPCTKPVAQGEDERAGRWAGNAKTECGIHTLLKPKEA